MHGREYRVPERRDDLLSSKKKTLTNIVKSYLGISVLFLPSVFRNNGIVLTSLIYVVVYLLSTKTMLLLVEIKKEILEGSRHRLKREVCSSQSNLEEVRENSTIDQDTQDNTECTLRGQSHDIVTYHDIGYEAMGFTGGLAIDLCLLCSHVGFSLTSHIFVGDVLTSFFPSISKAAWMCIASVPLFLLCCVKHLKFIAFVSFTSLVLFLGGYICILAVPMSDGISYEHINYSETSLESILTALSAIFYSFEGVGLVLPIEQSMKDRSKFSTLYYVGLLFVTFVYVTFGLFGYLSYGNHINGNVMKDFVLLYKNKHAILPRVVEAGFMLGAFGTYALILYPVSERIDHIVASRAKISNDSNKAIIRTKWLLVRIGLVLITLILGSIFRTFDSVIKFIGGFLATILMYILPSLFYIIIIAYPDVKILNSPFHNMQLKKCVPILPFIGCTCILVLGIIANILCTLASIKSIIDGR